MKFNPGEVSVVHRGLSRRFSATADQLYESATQIIKGEQPDVAQALTLLQSVHEILEQEGRDPNGFRNLARYTHDCEKTLGLMRDIRPFATLNAKCEEDCEIHGADGFWGAKESRGRAERDQYASRVTLWKPSVGRFGARGERLWPAAPRGQLAGGGEQLYEVSEHDAQMVAKEAQMKPAHEQLLKRYARRKCRAAFDPNP
jgi:hypothetical protein